jgi:hypothetical protein
MDYGNWTKRDDVKGQPWSNHREKGHKQDGQDTRYGFTMQTIHNYEMCRLLSESRMSLCLPGATNILRHRPGWRQVKIKLMFSPKSWDEPSRREIRIARGEDGDIVAMFGLSTSAVRFDQGQSAAGDRFGQVEPIHRPGCKAPEDTGEEG